MTTYIASGVTSTGLIITSDSLYVTLGGTAINTTISGDSDRYGFMSVDYGGSARNTTVNPYGQLNISSGASVTEIKENGGCVNVGNSASVTFVPNVFSGVVDKDASVHSGTTAYAVTVSNGGQLYVYSGGSASQTVVDSSCRMTVISGGVAIDTTVSSGAIFSVREDGSATGVTVLSSGSLSVQSGGSMQNIVVSSGGSFTVSSGATATNVTLSGGRLIAASGATVEGFVNKKGSVYAPEGATVISKGKTSGSSKLEVSSDCDSGWNNYLYAKKKTPPLNTSVYSATAQSVTTKTKGVLLDKSGAVSHDGKSNYVGYGDEADFTKIKLTCGARLAFNLETTGSMKFTIWSLTVSGYDRKGDPKYKMKAVQTVTIKSGQSEADTLKKAPLLVKGDYYISVEAVKSNKGGSAYYNVSLNSDSVFYSKGDNSDDDGTAFVDQNYSGAGYLGTLTASKGNVLSDWVGFGDLVDYRKFTLAADGAMLSFAVSATDAASISIVRIDSKTNRKGVTVYSEKKLCSAKLKKTGDGEYFVLTKPVLLEAGDYYLCVTSTNGKKGGSAEYSVFQNEDECVYFNRGNHNDDWTDMAEKGAAGKVVKFGEIKSTTTNVLTDWVGYGDAVDYRQFTIKSGASVSFEISADDAVKFTVYRLESRTDKKGNTTYSLKKLQSTGVKADFPAQTKKLKLEADTYYFCVESTNAKKGGNASYSIRINEFSALPQKGKDASALSMPDAGVEWGAIAEAEQTALAAPETTPGSGCVTLSGGDLADLAMSGTCDPAASPIPVAASDDLFAGLSDSVRLPDLLA